MASGGMYRQSVLSVVDSLLLIVRIARDETLAIRCRVAGRTSAGLFL